MRDRLTEAGPRTTPWQSESEYRFSSLMMPGAFPGQSRQHMLDFTAFAEQGQDVRDAR